MSNAGRGANVSKAAAVTRVDSVVRLVGVVLAATVLPACEGRSKESVMAMHETGTGPLNGADVMAFSVVRDNDATRSFYEKTLGLRVLMDDAQALVLSSGGTVIRLQKSANHEPAPYTVLGWAVPDIRLTARRLRDVGVRLERYEWMPFQDDACIATFPNGDMVAWFKDNDGNVLSIAQLK